MLKLFNYGSIAYSWKKHIIGLEDNSHYESETTRSRVDIISDQLFSKWIAEAESTIEMRVEGLYSMLKEFSEEMNDLKKQVEELQKSRNASTSYHTHRIVVPDYEEDLVQHHKEKILELILEIGTLDPWNYAEKMKIDVELAILCFDELINEGRLEKVND